jgi:hypothetical protein
LGAEWLKKNEKPLELFVEASKRTRYFCPFLPQTKKPALTANYTFAGSKVRRAGEALCARAMLRLNDDKVNEARDDLLSAHRLAHLLAEDPSFESPLWASFLEESAMTGMFALSHYVPRNVAVARELDGQIQRTAEWPRRSELLLSRCEYLDSLCYVISGMEQSKSGVDWLAARALVDPLLTRWNDALRSSNAFYDHIAEAENNPDRNERVAALRAIDEDLKALYEKTKSLNEKAGFFRCLPRPYWSSPLGAWGHAMQDTIESLSACNYEATNDLRDYAVTRGQLYRLAAKIGVFRAEHGSYPKRMEDLVPDYLPKLPVDMFHGNQFRYRLHGEGYVLYSLGKFEKDSDNLDWLKGNDGYAVGRRRLAIVVPAKPVD